MSLLRNDRGNESNQLEELVDKFQKYEGKVVAKKHGEKSEAFEDMQREERGDTERSSNY